MVINPRVLLRGLYWTSFLPSEQAPEWLFRATANQLQEKGTAVACGQQGDPQAGLTTQGRRETSQTQEGPAVSRPAHPQQRPWQRAVEQGRHAPSPFHQKCPHQTPGPGWDHTQALLQPAEPWGGPLLPVRAAAWSGGARGLESEMSSPLQLKKTPARATVAQALPSPSGTEFHWTARQGEAGEGHTAPPATCPQGKGEGLPRQQKGDESAASLGKPPSFQEQRCSPRPLKRKLLCRAEDGGGVNPPPFPEVADSLLLLSRVLTVQTSHASRANPLLGQSGSYFEPTYL